MNVIYFCYFQGEGGRRLKEAKDGVENIADKIKVKTLPTLLDQLQRRNTFIMLLLLTFVCLCKCKR